MSTSGSSDPGNPLHPKGAAGFYFYFFFLTTLDTEVGVVIQSAPERTDTVMKLREDERGNLVRTFEEGDGIRRRFYDSLDESRFAYPRKTAVKHAFRWYCDGHMEARPAIGIYNVARLAEHMLAMSRETGVPPLRDAARFFASTRRAMRNVLSHHRVSTRLDRKGVSHVRKIYLKLCSEGSAFLSKLGLLTPTTGV